MGARILLGGEPLPGPGRFFPPTIIVDASEEMAVMREETFGPLIAVQSV